MDEQVVVTDRQIELSDRQVVEIEMVRKGLEILDLIDRGFTLSKIAACAKVPLQDIGRFKNIGLRYLRDMTAQEVDLRRHEIDHRLDYLLNQLQGGIDKGDPACIRCALDIEKRRAEMFGLDKPVQVKVSGAVGVYPGLGGIGKDEI